MISGSLSALIRLQQMMWFFDWYPSLRTKYVYTYKRKVISKHTPPPGIVCEASKSLTKSRSKRSNKMCLCIIPYSCIIWLCNHSLGMTPLYLGDNFRWLGDDNDAKCSSWDYNMPYCIDMNVNVALGIFKNTYSILTALRHSTFRCIL